MECNPHYWRGKPGADTIKLYFGVKLGHFTINEFFICNKCKSLPAKNGKNLRYRRKKVVNINRILIFGGLLGWRNNRALIVTGT